MTDDSEGIHRFINERFERFAVWLWGCCGLDDWNLTGLQAVQEGFLSRRNISHRGMPPIFNCEFVYLVDPCWLYLFLWLEEISASGNILISVKWTSAMAIQTFPGWRLFSLQFHIEVLTKKGKAVPKPYRTGLDLACTPSLFQGSKLYELLTCLNHANLVRRKRPIISLLLGYCLGLFFFSMFF